MLTTEKIKIMIKKSKIKIAGFITHVDYGMWEMVNNVYCYSSKSEMFLMLSRSAVYSYWFTTTDTALKWGVLDNNVLYHFTTNNTDTETYILKVVGYTCIINIIASIWETKKTLILCIRI